MEDANQRLDLLSLERCVAGVCVEETGFRRESAHYLTFEESAGCEDAERPEVHSQAEPVNEGGKGITTDSKVVGTQLKRN
jgi:hypothetical protein